MLLVTLKPGETAAAAAIGRKRETLRKERGRHQNFDALDHGGSLDYRNEIGAIAEYALARHFGKHVLQDWCDHKSFSLEHWTIPCDVGRNLHVRATQYRTGRLIAHPYDPDEGVFVLARVSGCAVQFVGWQLGGYCKSARHWTDTGPGFGKRPAFVVPNENLLPFDQIPPEAVS